MSILSYEEDLGHVVSFKKNARKCLEFYKLCPFKYFTIRET
jgi:hypothetical protein